MTVEKIAMIAAMRYMLIGRFKVSVLCLTMKCKPVTTQATVMEYAVKRKEPSRLINTPLPTINTAKVMALQATSVEPRAKLIEFVCSR